MFTHRIDDDRWLQLAEESDAERMYELTASERPMLAAWMPWAAEATLDSTCEFIRSSRQSFADDQGFSAMIVERGELVGSIGFPELNRYHRSCEIGYWIARRAQGRGTVTLAVRALIEHAFGAWELNRVVIRAGVDNLRSRAVAERLGFTLEGVLRQAQRFPDGQYVDDALYALLASEWRDGERG